VTRIRKRPIQVGRTEHVLHLPYPAADTAQGMKANIQQIHRWANDLPTPQYDSFVPYFLEWQVTEEADAQDEWDFNFIEAVMTKYDIDFFPAGMWIVYASLTQTALPAEAIGVRGELRVLGPNGSSVRRGQAGTVTEAIRIISNVNFIDEELEYEWVAPPGSGAAGNVGLELDHFNIVEAPMESFVGNEIKVQGKMESFTITDSTVSGDLTTDPLPSWLYVWALRMSDTYNTPTDLEDVSPD